MFRNDWVQIMAADSSAAPCVARTSAAMVLSIQDTRVLCFRQCWEMMENEMHFMSSKNIQHQKG